MNPRWLQAGEQWNNGCNVPINEKIALKTYLVLADKGLFESHDIIIAKNLADLAQKARDLNWIIKAILAVE